MSLLGLHLLLTLAQFEPIGLWQRARSPFLCDHRWKENELKLEMMYYAIYANLSSTLHSQ